MSRTLLLAALLLGACSDDTTGESADESECGAVFACPSNSSCIDGVCVDDGSDAGDRADAKDADDSTDGVDGDDGDADSPDVDRDVPDEGMPDMNVLDVGDPDVPDSDGGDIPDADPAGSAGCGLPASDPLGGVNITIDAGSNGDGMRRFFLTLPPNYDSSTPHKLVFGYAGTNWVGEQIRPYLALEGGATDEIFVYPDPLWRDFPGWGNLGGWVLGPHAAPANGLGDLVFTEVILDYMETNYCIDTERIFATGHSWGGDMAQVVSCFLGDRFRATVPVAANRPYWFEPSQGDVECTGDTAVWTMFGVADNHFTWQDYAGQFGDQCRDFWLEERNCDGVAQSSDLPWGEAGECVEYTGCDTPTRYCLYGPASGHQIPSYFSAATMGWFREF